MNILKLSEFNAKIQDGHSDGILFFSNPDFVSNTISYLPFGLDYIENKYIVSRSFDIQKFPLGSEVISIEGEPPLEYLEHTVGRIVGLQTPLAREFRLGFMFKTYGRRGTSIRVKLKDADNREHIETACWEKGYSNKEELLDYQNNNTLLYDSQDMKIFQTPEDFFVIRCYSLKGFGIYEEMAAILEKYKYENKGMVLDFRYCEGGNSDVGRKIVEYCSGKILPGNNALSTIEIGYDMAAAIVFKENNESMNNLYAQTRNMYLNGLSGTIERGEKMLRRSYLIDENEYQNILKALGEEIETTAVPKGEKASHNKNTVMLIGHKAGSAVDCIAAMANSANIVTVGTLTNGAAGNIAYFDIGDNYKMGVTLENVLTPEGSRINNVGVRAQMYVEENLENFRCGIDTQLNYALEILGEITAHEND